MFVVLQALKHDILKIQQNQCPDNKQTSLLTVKDLDT